MSKWRKIMYNRGTMTYRNGKIDFSHGEGGNNHIHVYDANGEETGYIWYDTHVGDSRCGFCGTGTSSCNGLFREALAVLYNADFSSTYILDFTEEMFDGMMNYVLDIIR